MGKRESKNIFQMESLEPRVMLSTDPVVGGIAAGVLIHPEDFLNGVAGDRSTEEMLISQDLVLVSGESGPFLEVSGDVFDGLEDNGVGSDPVAIVPDEGAPSTTDVGVDSQLSVLFYDSTTSTIISPADGDSTDTGRGRTSLSRVALADPQFHVDTITTGDEIFIDTNVVVAEDAQSTHLAAVDGIGAALDAADGNVDGIVQGAIYFDTTNAGAVSQGSDIFITGNINGVSGDDGESLYLNAGTDGDILIQGDVGLSAVLETVHIINARNVVFNGQVVLSGDLIQSGGTGTSEFQLDVTAGGDINVATFGSITFGSDVESLGGNVTLEVDTVSAATGLITVKNNTRVQSGSLNLVDAKNVRFEGAVEVSGAVIQTAGTQITRFDGQVTAGSMNLTVEEQIRFLDTLTINTGPTVLTSDEIDFEGGEGSIVGQGTLTLRPTTEAVSIDVGSPSGGTGTLSLSDADLAALEDGFTTIVIGYDADAGHSIVFGTATFKDPVEVYAGAVTIQGDVRGVESALLNARTGNITVDTGELRIDNEEVNDVWGDASITFAAAAGNIVLTNDGSILTYVNDPADTDQGSIVSLTSVNGYVARQTGSDGLVTTRNLTVTASGKIDLMTEVETLNASSTTAGNIDIIESDGIDLVSVTAADGAIDVRVGGTVIARSLVSTTDGDDNDITVLTTAGDLLVHVVDAKTQGEVSLTAEQGAVVDASVDDAAVNVVGDGFSVTAMTGIGASGIDDLDVQLTSSLSAENTGPTGDIVITQADAGGDLSVDASQSNLEGGGSVVVTVVNGDLTVAAPGVAVAGTGNVLLTSPGAGNRVVLDAAVSAGTGSITVNAAGDVVLEASGDITVSGGEGTVEVTAGGGITMADGRTVETSGGNIRLDAGTDIVLGLVDARTAGDRAGETLDEQSSWGMVSLTAAAGGITDAAADDGTVDMYASAARLTGKTKVGESAADGGANAVETEVGTVTVAIVAADPADSGTVNIYESTDVVVGTVGSVVVHRVAADGSTSDVPVGEASQSDLVSDSDGSIELTTIDGTVTIDGGGDATGVESDGDGAVLLKAQGAGKDVLIDADVVSNTGTLTVISAGGDVRMAIGAALVSDGRDIAVEAATDIVVGLVDGRTTADRDGSMDEQGSWGTVSMTATAGGITDAASADAAVDIYAAGVRLTARTNVGELTADGGLNPIETEVVTVTALTTTVTSEDTGSIGLVDSTDVTVGTVDGQSDLATGSDGSIVLRTVDGSITVPDGADESDQGITADGTGNILLDAGGTGGVTLGSVVSTGSGGITVNAAGSVTLQGFGDVRSGGTGTVEVAAGGGIAMAEGRTVMTSGGNIRLDAGTGIVVGLVDARTAGDRGRGEPGRAGLLGNGEPDCDRGRHHGCGG